MLKSYLTTALHTLLKNKIYVLIKVFGMGIAMACCITAYLFIAHNVEFDNYFTERNVDNILKLMHHYATATEENRQELVCAMALAPAGAGEISGITAHMRYGHQSGVMSAGENAFEESIRFTDASFFDLFNVGVVKGSRENFNEKLSVFLSEAVASKYFGQDDPIGQSMSVDLYPQRRTKEIGVRKVLGATVTDAFESPTLRVGVDYLRTMGLGLLAGHTNWRLGRILPDRRLAWQPLCPAHRR